MKGPRSGRIVAVAVLFFVLSMACGRGPEAGIVISGMALAGPVCPVETNPPDPACAPRPVVGAMVLAVSESGDRVEVTTGPDGRFSFDVAAGRYQIVAQPFEGLMGTPEPVEVEAASGSIDVGVLMYDTGIR
ncbi:MAG TPA: carboxypeptidase-like regulatory domain-containing protein [Acidimicrobiia bacterium]|nr:carboxypeptidase-like regulatory domain-containing protein [Acidimicrobiia bacterium]